MPKANKFAKSVSLDDLPDNEKGKPVPMVSLFDQKNVKGWWPMYEEGGPDQPRELTVSMRSKEDSFVTLWLTSSVLLVKFLIFMDPLSLGMIFSMLPVFTFRVK